MVQKGRLQFLRFVVVFALLVVAGRLLWIQVVKADEITELGYKYRLVKVTDTPVRGGLYDRSLRPLAVSVPYYRLAANATQFTEERHFQKAAEALAEPFGVTEPVLRQKVRENPRSGNIVLATNLSLEQKEFVDKLGLTGIYLERDSSRTYPGQGLANKVIGYIADKVGAGGLESRYNSELAGDSGWVVGEVGKGNMPIESTIIEQKQTVREKNLVLTIDAALQKIVEDKLDAVVKEQDAKRAAVLVIDVHTGELLVMAERPGADPGDPKTWGNPVDYSRLQSWTVTPMPLGSIFKIITTAAALEERAITLNSAFVDTGEMRLPGCRIGNWDGYVRPDAAPKTPSQLMQNSSNVGLIQIGQKVSRETFEKYLRGFGFLEKTGIDLGYEEEPNLGSSFAEKKDCDWAGIYIGQHLELTPMQMITATAAIANGGKLVQPHLVREMRDHENKVVWSAPVQEKRTVISEATAKEVQQIMVSVIEEGTARAAKPDGYRVGGKTGTAQKFEGGKLKERYLADFVGFAPADNPRVAMIVLVDEPKGQGFGGIVAAPIFKELMPHVLRSVGIAPDSKAASGQEKAPATATAGVVPDVIWLPTAWAESRLAEAGFVPKLKGSGVRVATQSILPGQTARPGTVVELGLVAGNPADQVVHVPDFGGLSLAEANRLATELGLTLKSGGSGYVVEQEPKKGAVVPARSTLTVRLTPRR